MKSWTDWKVLWAGLGKQTDVKKVAKQAKGVYAIRIVPPPEDLKSDVVYIGCAGIGKHGVGDRLCQLRECLALLARFGTDYLELVKKRHYDSVKIWDTFKPHKEKARLEFSWTEVNKNPDGVEKAMLLAYLASTGNIPACNERF